MNRIKLLDITESEDRENFKESFKSLTNLCEGTAFGLMTYLYSFDYLRDNDSLAEIDEHELIKIWRSNILTNINSLQTSLYVANGLIVINDDLVKYWTTNRVSVTNFPAIFYSN